MIRSQHMFLRPVARLRAECSRARAVEWDGRGRHEAPLSLSRRRLLASRALAQDCCYGVEVEWVVVRCRRAPEPPPLSAALVGSVYQHGFQASAFTRLFDPGRIELDVHAAAAASVGEPVPGSTQRALLADHARRLVFWEQLRHPSPTAPRLDPPSNRVGQ